MPKRTTAHTQCVTLLFRLSHLDRSLSSKIEPLTNPTRSLSIHAMRGLTLGDGLSSIEERVLRPSVSYANAVYVSGSAAYFITTESRCGSAP